MAMNFHHSIGRFQPDRKELEEKFATWLGPEGAKTETARERIERRGSLGGSFVCQDCNDDLPPSYD